MQPQPVTASSQGIILFAQNYASHGFRQTAPRGSTVRELGELLAHEIGHFLFRLTHHEPPEPSPQGGFIVRDKTDFMRGGGSYDPQDRLGATSRREMERAFSTGTIPRPERSTR